MNQSLQLFSFEDQEIRVIVIDGEPWWVAKDVCSALGLTNVSQAMGHLDDDEKGICSVYTPGGNQKMLCINEPGLYGLVLVSRRPEAKAFKRWVKHDVIPSIRKTGSYSVDHRPTINNNYEQRLLINRDRDIRGYFTIIDELDQLSHKWRADLFEFSERSRPDISVSKMFHKHLRSIDYDMELVEEIKHVVDLDSGHEEWVAAFSYEIRGVFSIWFQEDYCVNHLAKYISGTYKGVPRISNHEDIPVILKKLMGNSTDLLR